jgi:DNA-binding response OmpR family regulator
VNNWSILVVEDEPSIAEVVGLYLRRSGFQVSTVKDGLEAKIAYESEHPDLIILDLMLPGIDGFELTKWLRNKSDVPIIMLTARRDEKDRIDGLEMGADDYVIKPFSPQELISRIRAVLRRTQVGKSDKEENPLIYPEIRIEPGTHIVIVRERESNLTVKEFDVLWLLAQHPRQVFTREQILVDIWGNSEYIDSSTVTVHVRRLREKIEEDPSKPRHIITVWGIGYKFEP